MDWYVAEGVSKEDAVWLTHLDVLRSDEPVLWALLMGLKTSESIAKHICWPHHWVLGTLRRYKEEGLVWDHEGRASVIWDWESYSDELSELRHWIMHQRQPGGIFRQINRNDE